jgi:hypothetical protein
MPISLQRTASSERVHLPERKWRGVNRKEALRLLKFGSSVAEADEDLQNYFVETESFRSLVNGDGDIIAGDKGTGKSAFFKILAQRYEHIPELERVALVPAFNTGGDPVFQQLAEGQVFTEGQYRTIWKTYVLSLGGNSLLEHVGEKKYSPNMKKLDSLLNLLNLRRHDDEPTKVFRQLVKLIQRLMTPKTVGVEFSFDEAGLPVTTPQVEFGTPEDEATGKRIIRHTESLGLLNAALKDADWWLWLVLDRLDEAFTGYPATEIPALRALFRTYLDLAEFDRIKLKMFVRKDLFRKVTQGGFVNLTHINAKKIEIVWDDSDLLNLLIQRVKANEGFMKAAGLQGKSNSEIFYSLFPPQVEEGSRRPKTLDWMLSRIRDGQNVKPPRNLIELVSRAREEQLRAEDREPHDYKRGDILVASEAIKSALTRLSKDRVEDTLLAESGEYQEYIEKFRGGKAEHNFDTLRNTLNLQPGETLGAIRVLIDMGFLERTGETYKIPMLYRDGLNITQGKAFQTLSEEADNNQI